MINQDKQQRIPYPPKEFIARLGLDYFRGAILMNLWANAQSDTCLDSLIDEAATLCDTAEEYIPTGTPSLLSNFSRYETELFTRNNAMDSYTEVILSLLSHDWASTKELILKLRKP